MPGVGPVLAFTLIALLLELGHYPGGLRANYGERLGWPLPPPLAWNARSARCASSGAASVGRLAKQDRRGALTGTPERRHVDHVRPRPAEGLDGHGRAVPEKTRGFGDGRSRSRRTASLAGFFALTHAFDGPLP